jgi:ABC-type branched-subunit amino acid transport system ATPase component
VMVPEGRQVFPELTVRENLGSGLIAHSQKMTVAARAMAERKAIGHLS